MNFAQKKFCLLTAKQLLRRRRRRRQRIHEKLLLLLEELEENKQTRKSSNEGGIKKLERKNMENICATSSHGNFLPFIYSKRSNFHNFQVHTAAHVSK